MINNLFNIGLTNDVLTGIILGSIGTLGVCGGIYGGQCLYSRYNNARLSRGRALEDEARRRLEEDDRGLRGILRPSSTDSRKVRFIVEGGEVQQPSESGGSSMPPEGDRLNQLIPV